MKPRTTLTLVLLVGGVAALAPRCNVGPGPSALVLANFLLVMGCWVLAVVLHELAHVGVARALGIDVAAIVIGTGRLLWATRWRGIAVRVTSKPWSGFVVLSANPGRVTVPRMLAFFAAGAAANALVVGALTGIWGDPRFDRWTSVLDLRGAAVTANVLVVLLNLFPWKAEVTATDGWRILSLLFRPRGSLAQIARSSAIVRALVAMREESWASAREQLVPMAEGDDDVAKVARSMLHAVEGEEARSAGDLERERAAAHALAASDVPPVRRAGQLSLALLELETPPHAAAPALKRARRAAAEDPDGDLARLALGAALAASGKFDDARRQLEGAALLSPSSEATRLAFLALAKLGAGNSVAARGLIDRASTLTPGNRSIPAVGVWARRLGLGQLAPTSSARERNA